MVSTFFEIQFTQSIPLNMSLSNTSIPIALDKREASNLQARAIPENPERDVSEEATRDVDSVNLNVKEGRGLLMRFVEEDVADELDAEIEDEP
jgi:hypothetical protein